MTQNNPGDHKSVKSSDHRDASSPLSQRQRQILTLLKAGRANKEIAHELEISVGTVKQHLVSLFRRLGVTNRTMAIAKSYTLAGMETGPNVTEHQVQHSPSDETSILEKRPAAVLSLKLDTPDEPSREETVKAFYKTFTEVAFDFGAIFFSHNSGHCEMIFGVGRVRRHDVLRAIRAGVAVVEDLRMQSGRYPKIRGGLTFGTLVASTDKTGAWSGEAIAGAVISMAHDLALNAAPGEIHLDDPARLMIRFLGIDSNDGVPRSIPLTRNFHWRRAPLPTPRKLCGRIVELEHLRRALLKAKGGSGGPVIIDGENGMGRSALLQTFAKLCHLEDMGVETWVCSLPDTQPGTASLGVLEKPGTDFTRDLTDFSDDLRRRKNLDATVILIDDVHLLPKPHMAELAALVKSLKTSPALIVMTGRGRMPGLDTVRDRAVNIHLKHLTSDEAREMVNSLPGAGHRHGDRIVSMASGVPKFIIELASSLTEQTSDDPEKNLIPLTLFSVVSERIELIGLDRRFLHLVANRPEPVRVEDIRKSWPTGSRDLDRELEKALRMGVLYAQAGDKFPDEFISFRNPVVRNVMAAATAGKDDLLR